MSKSKIDYADWSWGIVDGCTPLREGCHHCFAHSMADRFWGERKFSDVRIHPERLDEVINLKPQIVFVAPMGDLFHKDVPDEFIEQAFSTMAVKARQHSYILFTKRPERMRDFMKGHHEFVQPHIWLGVSVSTRKDVDEFMPILCATPAGKQIVSAEPLLENIDMSYFLYGCPEQTGSREYVTHEMALDAGYPEMEGQLYRDEEWIQTCPPIDWVVAGCESGTNRRKAEMDWFRRLLDDCKDAGVPFYLKQMDIDGKIVHKPYLDGRQWLEMPERK